MCNVVIEKEIVNILLGNRIIETKLFEDFCQNLGNLSSCQCSFITSIEFCEECFDSNVNCSCFFLLGVLGVLGKCLLHFLESIISLSNKI